MVITHLLILNNLRLGSNLFHPYVKCDSKTPEKSANGTLTVGWWRLMLCVKCNTDESQSEMSRLCVLLKEGFVAIFYFHAGAFKLFLYRKNEWYYKDNVCLMIWFSPVIVSRQSFTNKNICTHFYWQCISCIVKYKILLDIESWR